MAYALFMGIMNKRLSTVVTLAIFALVAVSAAEGRTRLDQSFGNRGILGVPGLIPISVTPSGVGHRMASYPDGRLIVGGSSPLGFTVRRYLADGKLDPSFGEHGITTITVPGGEPNREGARGSATALAVQPDGKILVGGSYLPYSPEECGDECEEEAEEPMWTALARLNPDGGLDPSFGGNRKGRHLGEVLSSKSSSINDVAIQGEKILIAGEEESTFTSTGYVARFDLNGAPDRTFGAGDGWQGIPELPKHKKRRFSPSAAVSGISLGHGGQVYAAGYKDGRFMLARLTRRGRLDRRFHRSGIVATSFMGGHCACSWGEGITRDRHGRLLVSGYLGKGTEGVAIAVARYLPDGELDRTFGRRGLATIRVRARTFGYGVAVQPNGSIVVAGSSSGPRLRDESFTVVRFRSDGQPDRSFFRRGVFRAHLDDRALQPLVDPSGRLLVSGEKVVVRFANVGRAQSPPRGT
jgi:uncharacterized delta-60 repeat protein